MCHTTGDELTRISPAAGVEPPLRASPRRAHRRGAGRRHLLPLPARRRRGHGRPRAERAAAPARGRRRPAGVPGRSTRRSPRRWVPSGVTARGACWWSIWRQPRSSPWPGCAASRGLIVAVSDELFGATWHPAFDDERYRATLQGRGNRGARLRCFRLSGPHRSVGPPTQHRQPAPRPALSSTHTD